MPNIPSLLRNAEHKALSSVEFNGSVLDLGGDRKGEYLKYIKGDFKITSVNLADSNPDITHDLEKSLPIKENSYDNVLLMNVLEHIFNYRELLKESVRVLKPNGKIVVVVPFLFPVHPSPNDYHRFTDMTLEKEFSNLGLKNIKILPLGTGLFSVRYLLIDRLLPSPIRFIRYYIARPFVILFDYLFAFLAKKIGKKYDPKDYPLGYIACASK